MDQCITYVCQPKIRCNGPGVVDRNLEKSFLFEELRSSDLEKMEFVKKFFFMIRDQRLSSGNSVYHSVHPTPPRAEGCHASLAMTGKEQTPKIAMLVCKPGVLACC